MSTNINLHGVTSIEATAPKRLRAPDGSEFYCRHIYVKDAKGAEIDITVFAAPDGSIEIEDESSPFLVKAA